MNSLATTSICMLLMLPAAGVTASAGPQAPRHTAAAVQTRPEPATTPWARYQTAGVEAMRQRNYPAAERSFLLGLESATNAGAPGTTIATIENALGLVYRQQQRLPESEQMYLRALASVEKAPGATLTDVSSILSNLAALLVGQQRYADAERFLRRAVSAAELALPDDDYKLALPLYRLGEVCLRRRNFADADVLLARSLAIRERHRGAHALEVGLTLQKLAAVRIGQGRASAAWPLYDRAIVIVEGARGKDDAAAISLKEEYAAARQKAERGR